MPPKRTVRAKARSAGPPRHALVTSEVLKSWKAARSDSYTTVCAPLAESIAFEWFRSAGVLLVKSYEASKFDGALIMSVVEAEGDPAPDHDASWYELWHWATERQRGASFCEFDVKFVAIRPSSVGARAYVYGNSCGDARTKAQNCAFIAIICESDRFHIALVPKTIYDAAREVSFGLEPLISRSPVWCAPFFVHRDDLAAAQANLLKAAMGEAEYVNPTVGVAIRNWIPPLTKQPVLSPTASGPMIMRSFAAVTNLWRRFEALGCRIDFNPAAPLIRDFHVRTPDLPSDAPMFRVEHKFQADYNFATGKASPFSSARAWHYCIVELTGENQEFLCIPRHLVNVRWQDASRPMKSADLAAFRFRGSDALKQVVRVMHQNAKAVNDFVIAHAEQTVPATMQELLTSNTNADDMTHEQDESEILEFKQRRQNDVALPWLCQHLNTQLRHLGFGIILPMDYGHPIGDHVFVDYVWREIDIKNFDKNGLPPKPAYHKDIVNKPAIALRFQDYTPEDACRSPVQGAWVRPSNWRLPAVNQHVIFVGKVLKGTHDTRHPDDEFDMIASSLLCLPSEQTTLFASGIRASSSPPSPATFLRKTMAEDVMKPFGKDIHAMSIIRFLAPGIRPDRNLLDARRTGEYNLVWNLMKVLRSKDPVTIENMEGGSTNPAFDPEPYRTTLRRMHQAAIDHGLQRKPARAGNIPDTAHYGRGHPKRKAGSHSNADAETESEVEIETESE